MATDRETEDVFRRIQRLLPKSSDLTLILLKGHLLIEEQLEGFTARAVRNAKPLIKARLTFAQKSALVEALSGSAEVCRFANELNALRNKLAHNVDVPDLSERVDSLLKRFVPALDVQRFSARRRATLLGRLIVMQYAKICGFTRGYGAAGNAEKIDGSNGRR